ncbi:MAG: glycosyltransferase family 4 protein [Syntrophobacterales bacterium]|nr:glycosyltransferase family 4 protein [Syntrophobacterales bacterium]
MKTPWDRVRVVHIITRFDKGGSAENTFLTLRDLNPQRYRQFLLCGPPDAAGKEGQAVADNLAVLAQRDVEVIIVPSLMREVDPLCDLKAFFQLRSLLLRLRPALCHTHTSKAGILGRWAAKTARVPIVVHTPHGHIFWGYFGPLRTRLFVLLERVTAKLTDRIITLTRQELEDHLRFRIAPPEKFTVIHSGVALERFSQIISPVPPSEWERDIPTDAFVIGTVGRLTAIKGQRFLLEATAKLKNEIPELFCLIVGDGELRQELETLAVTLGIGKRVIFPGWRRDVANYIAVMDLFVMPSLNEGMGRTVVEAMAAEKAIVASDVGGLKDLVTPGVNGLLIPPGDEEALTAAIKQLYKNPERRRSMGQNGRMKANTFSSTAMIKKIDELYTELLKENRMAP